MNKKTLYLLVATLLFSGAAFSDTENLPLTVGTNDNGNIVNLDAQGKIKIQKNYLTITLSYKTHGSDPEKVQADVMDKVSKALDSIKKQPSSDKIKVSTDTFNIYPSDIDGKTDKGYPDPHYQHDPPNQPHQEQPTSNADQDNDKWIGQGSIIIEGNDFALISKIASETKNFVISNVSVSVDPQDQKNLRSETVSKAISQFKSNAQSVAESFGFKGYKIKNISVNYDNPNFGSFQPRFMMAKVATVGQSAEQDTSSMQFIAPSYEDITATVSGTIELTTNSH